jgi:tRNA A-37 threonylcarbamoyl transferase component Bud32/DNA-binding beta-propeller fold protein YncE
MIAVACPRCGTSAPLAGEARAAVCAKCGEALPMPADDGRTLPPSQGSSLPGEERASSAPAVGAITASLESAAVTGEPAHDTADLCACLAPPEAADELGRLGNYRVLRILGAGGMGVVFEAEDLNLKRRVALKALLPTLGASATARRRFLREARAAAEVESDHVVAIYQIGEDRGVPYLAMQFLKGESLDVRMRRTRSLPMSEVLRIGREIALGLSAAHAKGLVHRDVKPSNTWLEVGTGRVKILDFGLARSASGDSELTRQGAILGTPAYMSPEQARGLPATFQSDLFSLGTLLYQLCTGKHPFKGNDTVDTLLAVATDAPPSPCAINADVPPGLDNLIMHLLAKDAKDRPGSARAVADVLGMIDPASRAEPADVVTTSVPVVTPAAPRHRVWLVASLLVIVALGVFLFGPLFERWRQGRFSRRPAPTVADAASPLDRLDPDAVAATDRIPGLGRELVAVFGPRGGPSVQGVEFSRDGTMLLAQGLRFDAHVWDIATGQERSSFNARRATFAPDGQSLATVQGDGIRLLDLDGKVTGSVPVPPETEVFALDFSPDGRMLAWGGNAGIRKKLARGDGNVVVWDLLENKEMATFPGLPYAVHGIRYAPDGKRVAAMTADRSVQLWDLARRKEWKFEQTRGLGNVGAVLHSMRTSLMDFTPDGRKLAYARRSTVHVVDAESGTETSQIGPFSGNVHAVAFAPDGRKLAVCDARGQIALFDTAGKRMREWQLPGVVNDVTFAPDSRYLAVANFNGTVAVIRIGE